ncbi:MAG: gamma-glutamyl-gamma-aminobutyrate hydrolase family protein [Deltaproteobacteria bacterium]|nr:gamma-glutamyl-gamma-aminobutyrate hydrolase family protein [Deltaproteobacteria bacterium]
MARRRRQQKRPLVGITADSHTNWVGAGTDQAVTNIFHYRLKGTYESALRAAGCLPVVVPYLDGEGEIDSLARVLDGLVISGSGPDVDPWLQGRAPKPGRGTALRRHAFEMRLAARCIDSGRPVLGICGGEQVVNVLFGGTLIDDIGSSLPSALPHRGAYLEIAHEVEVEKGSLLRRAAGAARFGVNSTHHQAVDSVGPGLTVSARAPDGIIEAVEAPGFGFVLGVQWHPEALFDRRPHAAIFEAFATAASGGCTT